MTGIDVRHRKSFERHREDGKCCGASFQAHVFDKRSGKRIRKTFETKSAAKLWRQDAIAALRRGEYATITPTSRTVEKALGELLVGMDSGAVLDRSGRRYRPRRSAAMRRPAIATSCRRSAICGSLRYGEQTCSGWSTSCTRPA